MGSFRKDTMTLNELAKALCPLIPEGWELVVRFVKDEVSLTLYNPDGDVLEDWPDDLTTNEMALWYVNLARDAEGLPPGRVPGIGCINEHGVFEEA